MRYEKITDLPKTIRNQLPKSAQELYLNAYQRAWDAYEEEEDPGEQDQQSAAHRDAWAAVEREYEHDEESGVWHTKGKKPEDDGEAPGVLESLKNMV